MKKSSCQLKKIEFLVSPITQTARLIASSVCHLFFRSNHIAIGENSKNTAHFAGGVQKTPGGKFRPRVTINGVRQSLGLYDTEEEAVAVRDIILAAFPA